MEKIYPVLKNCPLFEGISEPDMSVILDCMSAKIDVFEKNDFIYVVGDPVSSLGVVLSGGVHIVQEDYWGNRTILTRIDPSGIFAEAFSCAGVTEIPVSVVAEEKSEIMMIEYGRVVDACSPVCGNHAELMKNMTRILAGKNIMLTQKIGHVTKRTTREKLLSYLSALARAKRGNSFDIPFNRQELADYLSVDRSAMSNELSKMRDEHILKYDKNHFELL
jgi:CRP-like cAMP-binding protein